MHRKVFMYLVILLSPPLLLAQTPAEPRPGLTASSLPGMGNGASSGLMRPLSPLVPAPVGAGTVAPPALVSGQPEGQHLVAENLSSFDPRLVELQWVNNRWQLQAGGVFLKDFGKRESEGREALRLIRELGLTERGTVGTPQPVMEYWLANGQAPHGSLPGLRLLPLDLNSLRIEPIQGQWCLRNARQTFFNFGLQADDARRALEIIQHYGFTQIGYVGLSVPSMVYFLGQPTGIARTQTPTPSPLVSRTVMANQSAEPTAPTPVLKRPPLAESSQPAPGNPPVQSPLPFGRQLAVANGSVPGLAAPGERIPFDWRRVEVRQDKQDWKLVVGSHTFANFGSQRTEARQALAAFQYYRFTEQHLLGSAAAPTLTYFLVNGQAPHGLLFGVDSVPFRPETLTVQRSGDKSYVLWDGNHAVWSFGDQAEEARQVLQVIQRYKFDHLCRLGSHDSPALTFFVRTR